jgi:Fe2+ or Zn2+ uptake regulation protein
VQADQEQQRKAAPTTTGQPRRSAARLEDRIAAVLEASEDPMTAADVLEAVNADGGKPVRLGSVRNGLVGLADSGDVERLERGLYAPAR